LFGSGRPFIIHHSTFIIPRAVVGQQHARFSNAMGDMLHWRGWASCDVLF
jgi:hypothetical protein